MKPLLTGYTSHYFKIIAILHSPVCNLDGFGVLDCTTLAGVKPSSLKLTQKATSTHFECIYNNWLFQRLFNKIYWDELVEIYITCKNCRRTQKWLHFTLFNMEWIFSTTEAEALAVLATKWITNNKLNFVQVVSVRKNKSVSWGTVVSHLTAEHSAAEINHWWRAWTVFVTPSAWSNTNALKIALI